MLKSKTFMKKTRSGGVLKIVREHYLRDDITCGCEGCEECSQENPVLQLETVLQSSLCTSPHYLLPDTNVLLHQVLKCHAIVLLALGLFIIKKMCLLLHVVQPESEFDK
uniref:Uncharacterized protein n=1 Tax=Leptobrachium leishanense TaxID=445787 RepID=A0A8C5WI91_9ANUR